MLKPLHRERACSAYLGLRDRILGDASERMPTIEEVSARLTAATGFRLQPAAETVEARTFFALLDAGVFPAIRDVRKPAEMFFSPRPDWLHEAVGHAVGLAHPGIAYLYRQFGCAARRATSAGELDGLTRVYWFTVEAGVVLEQGRPKAFGAALLSSAQELLQLGIRSTLRPFDAAELQGRPFDDSTTQTSYVAFESLDELLSTVGRYLASAS
jgi:phenylalanine-4-hydroxylase